MAELEIQQSNLSELLSALRDDPHNVSAKLTEWHAKLGEARCDVQCAFSGVSVRLVVSVLCSLCSHM